MIISIDGAGAFDHVCWARFFEELRDNVIVLDGYVPAYEDLFSKEVKKIIRIGQRLNERFSRRKEIINKTVNQSM